MFDYFRKSRKIGLERAGENQDFLSQKICLTVPKDIVREPLYAVFHKNYGSEKD